MPVLLGLAAGAVVGLLAGPVLPAFFQPYLPTAIVVMLGAILGGIRAWLEGIFSDRVFAVSFLSGVFIAGLVVFASDQIGVGSRLSTRVVVVFGIRIPNDAAAIRRAVLHA